MSAGPAGGGPEPDVSLVLKAVTASDSRAAAQLLPLVYTELRKLASARLAKLPPGQTLQPTALVHEAYVKLIGSADPGWDGRGHFFGAAAQAMRNIIVDHARSKASIKHGGDRAHADIGSGSRIAGVGELQMDAEQVLAIDAALEALKESHPRAADVVMLRYFAGLTVEQCAASLGVSDRTVKTDWRFAKAWLHARMKDGGASSES